MIKLFAERFKKLRLEKEINQKDLSKILQTSTSTIGMWEQGRRSPDKEMLVKIADYFDVSIDYLLGRTDSKHSIDDFEFFSEFTVNDDVRKNLPLEQALEISMMKNDKEKILQLFELTQKLNYDTELKDDTVLYIELGRANKKLNLNVEQIKSLLNYLDKIGFDIERSIENSSSMDSDK
ncbi:MAG: helix-turn-helix domain-containing protein [Sarcina sp.]